MRPTLAPALRGLQARIPAHAAIGFVGTEDSWDYPLFGAHREHRITRMLYPTEATYDAMARKHLAGVVFADVGPPHPPLRAVPIAAGYYWVPAKH